MGGTRYRAAFEAEAFRVGAQAFEGLLGVDIAPNINTAIGAKNGNLEAKLLGLGGAIGRDGLQIFTPVVDLKIGGGLATWFGGTTTSSSCSASSSSSRN